MKLDGIYEKLGCSKQNVSYWAAHPYSTQAAKSVRGVIRRAAVLFELSEDHSESLANMAGLSLSEPEDGGLPEFLLSRYEGRRKDLYGGALISERMFRHYKTMTPTKQALFALAIIMELDVDEMDALLRRCGYCLSKSAVGDLVVEWFVQSHGYGHTGAALLGEINTVLDRMGLPLLMTRQNE